MCGRVCCSQVWSLLCVRQTRHVSFRSCRIVLVASTLLIIILSTCCINKHFLFIVLFLSLFNLFICFYLSVSAPLPSTTCLSIYYLLYHIEIMIVLSYCTIENVELRLLHFYLISQNLAVKVKYTLKYILNLKYPSPFFDKSSRLWANYFSYTSLYIWDHGCIL